MKSRSEIPCWFEKFHRYTDQFEILAKNGLFFQLTMGRILSNSYHDHDFFELICVLSGSCTHFVNDARWHFTTGRLALLCPGSYHKLSEQSENTNILALSVTKEMMELFLNAYGVHANNENVLLDFETIRQIHRIAVEISLDEPENQVRRARILLGQLLSYMFSSSLRSGKKIPPNFAALLSQMNSLETVSEGIPAFLRLSNFSYPHLCRLTKQYLGMTPGEYITKLRLQYAYEMIAWGSDRYEDICDKVGFSSISHFTKLIRRHYGMTPARIRRQNMDTDPTV